MTTVRIELYAEGVALPDLVPPDGDVAGYCRRIRKLLWRETFEVPAGEMWGRLDVDVHLVDDD